MFIFNDLLKEKEKKEYNFTDGIKIFTCVIEMNFNGLNLENNKQSIEIFKKLYIESRFEESNKREKEFHNFEKSKKM